MTDKPDGGPAFAHTVYEHRHDQESRPVGSATGMSLRDYFAAHALGNLVTKTESSSEQTARIAYRYADAMLAVRDKS